MKTLCFSSKGKTLEDLAKVITTAKVLPILRFSISAFRNETEAVVNNIQRYFKENFLIIRSSAKNEDSLDYSCAGKFKTVSGVPKDKKDKIIDSINEVIVSYDSDDNNEILIQPMLSDIKMSGVVFTADIDTLAPYYIINYNEGDSADTVTKGRGGITRTYVYFKESPFQILDSYLLKLYIVCKELEKIFANPYLDIEFAFDKRDDLHIFQCRPLVVNNKENLSQMSLREPLSNIYSKVMRLCAPHPNLLGNKTIFGVMPDWNPAEMIGLKPRQLALSLYKELITDNIWAYQRDNYGYRNLRSHPLLISFLGIPYIDVRVDFNSFVPKSLNEKIAQKLVDYYLDKLDSTPTHHDKVEFEIIYSCYYINLSQKLKELLNFGFNDNEIKRIEFALLDITNSVIDPEHGLYKQDLRKIEILKEKYERIINSSLSLIDKIYWLLEDCKRYGTLPFAGIARAGFIAVQFLKSFVDSDIITQADYDKFMNSINTIAKKLSTDLCKLSSRYISKEKFLSEYGHLRPGTYDILSLRYDENFDYYFSLPRNLSSETGGYEFSDEQSRRIQIALIESGIKIDVSHLIQFIKESIEGREYAKFVFTKSVSEILRLIEQLGGQYGIDREELAHLDIKTVVNLYSVLEHRDIKYILESDIEKNKKAYKYTKAIKLPTLIKKAEDIYGFFIGNEEPTFVTLKRIVSEVVSEIEFKETKIENKIAIIGSADPGYDFLFTKNIAGLITQFGGANSHMAIRCAELGIPAVIGSGEKNFTEWSRAKMLEIDCANKNVRIIS